ncbi:MAG: hypothetical protein SFU56_19255 [Capsulimonadales bacterium]|nr:hypothetical protein [Capsulimonadales bacterium]
MAGRNTTASEERSTEGKGMEALRESPTMARLIEALSRGEDIGHYGQFVFVTTARHFLKDEEIADLLVRQPEMSEDRANAMVARIGEKGYNPPNRERLLEMQRQQEFRIIDEDDPDSGNLYRELSFPEGVYADIEEYHTERMAAKDEESAAN